MGKRLPAEPRRWRLQDVVPSARALAPPSNPQGCLAGWRRQVGDHFGEGAGFEEQPTEIRISTSDVKGFEQVETLRRCS